MPEAAHRPVHACLAGPCVTRDHELTDLLLPEFSVTLVQNARRLLENPLLDSVDILLLDCAQHPDATLALVPELKGRHRKIDIVLVDGGVTQSQLAAAFAAGARDYFPADYESRLLAGRVAGLARSRQRQAAERPCNAPYPDG